jgi:hypothetical protein
MLRQRILPAVLLVLPATTALIAQTAGVEATPETCRTAPGSAAPPGSRWYYRVNRADHSRCWYIGSQRVVVGSRAGRNAAFEPRSRLARRGHKMEPRTASAEIPPAVASLAVQQVTLPKVGAGWQELPESQPLEAHKVATTSYTRSHAATDADQQLSLVPILNPKRSERQAPSNEVALESVFLGGALATALLVASGVFHLARRRRRALSSDQRYATGDQEPSGNKLAKEMRHDAFIQKSPIRTDPLERSLRVLTYHLQLVAARRAARRSISPRTRTKPMREQSTVKTQSTKRLA